MVNFREEEDNPANGGYAPFGKYTIKATYGQADQPAIATYDFWVPSTGTPFYPSYVLSFNGRDYSLPYHLTSYTGPSSGINLRGITVSPSKNSLIIDITSNVNGSIDIQMPRSLINATYSKNNHYNNTDDVGFTIVEDGKKINSFFEIKDQGSLIRAHYPFGHPTVSPDARALEINFTSATKQIKIIGTQVVPEFGSSQSAITVAGIISTIGLTIFVVLSRLIRRNEV
jgi:hypothetical protein